MNFPSFAVVILLWLEKILGMISIFLTLSRLVLWHNMWSILKNVPSVLDKNVYSAVGRWSFLYMSVRSNWFIMLFKSYFIDLLSGCSVHYWNWNVEVSYYYFIYAVYFSLQFFQSLLLIWVPWLYTCTFGGESGRRITFADWSYFKLMTMKVRWALNVAYQCGS